MKRVKLLLIASLVGLLAAATSAERAVAPAHTALGSDLGPLRADFNAHAHQLRAVLLVAPT